MKLIALQSGSNGNCVYVEADGVRLLFDAGISGRQAQTRLAAHGREMAAVDALLISHDHQDHARSMGVYHRKFHLPIYATRGTLAAAQARLQLGDCGPVSCFSPGVAIHFGTVCVETVRTPHDGSEGVGFIVDDGRHRLGILTDLGHAFAGLAEILQSLDAVVLESNYDPDMLAAGPYPEYLKRRIRGPAGHLSNLDAARLLSQLGEGRLQWACLAHLSHENNRPQQVLATHRRWLGDRLPLFLASRDAATDLLEL